MTARPLIIAIDHGTTGLKILALDRAGVLRGRAVTPVTLSHPAPGWVEADAWTLWALTLPAIETALAQARAGWEDVHAIAITNQRESVVAWDDDTGEPLAPAIIWQCRRTAAQCETLRKAGVEPLIRARTGLLLDPYFSATKYQWLLENVTAVSDRAKAGKLRFGTIDSWILWRLSGKRLHISDLTNASRTLLFDIHRRQWDEELLALFNVPASALAQVTSSCAVYGATDPALTGGRAIPLAGNAGDQQAGLYGQRAWTRGATKLTIGTGAFLLANLGSDAQAEATSAPGLLTTLACNAAGEAAYALEGGVFCAGAALNWLGDALGLFADATQADRLAASVPDSGGVTMIPAFTGLGAPHWRPEARGQLLGLSLRTTPAHLARAAFDAIALRAHDNLRALTPTVGPVAEIHLDGGVSQSPVLRQTLADILGVRLLCSDDPDVTARGAAYLGGLASGFWSSSAAIADLPHPAHEALPQRDAAWRAERLAHWDAAQGALLESS